MSFLFSTIKALCIVILSMTLLFSLGLHTVDVTHTHHHALAQGAHDDTHGVLFEIEEYTHGTEQKFFLLILLTLLASVVLIVRPWLTEVSVICLATNYCSGFLEKNVKARIPQSTYLQEMFSSGVLNPKVH